MTVTRVVYPGGDPTDKFQIGCFFKMLMYSYPAREEELIREFDLDKGAWEKDGYAFVGIPLGRARTLFRAVYHNAPEDIRRMFPDRIPEMTVTDIQTSIDEIVEHNAGRARVFSTFWNTAVDRKVTASLYEAGGEQGTGDGG